MKTLNTKTNAAGVIRNTVGSLTTYTCEYEHCSVLLTDRSDVWNAKRQTLASRKIRMILFSVFTYLGPTYSSRLKATYLGLAPIYYKPFSYEKST